ncbi:MAG: trigger factor [Methylococcales bacterium]
MQVSVEQTSELKRKMKVQVPEEAIQSECAKRIDSLARKARIDGFRPGKVPVGVIRKRFGDSVRNEVIGELIRSSLLDAFKDYEIRPAGIPHIESTVDEAGKGLEFEASFEIYPNVQITSFKDLDIVRPVCEISESDIDAMIENLRRQRRTWRSVERKAIEKDKLTLSLASTIDGEILNGGVVDDYEIEIGAGQMIPGFEQNLIGLKSGSEKAFTLNFPEDYNNQKCAGKLVEFKVQVKKVEESVLPDFDHELIKQLGVESGDVDEFRRSLKETMEFEKNREIRSRTKAAVIDAMLKAHTVPLPEIMVDREIEELKKQHASQHAGCETEHGEYQRTYYESQARRRLKLGLLLSEIVNRNKLEADKARVRQTVESLAHGFNAPDEVVNWYYSNPDQLQPIENMVLEDQVVELILKGANVSNEPIEFASLTIPDRPNLETKIPG